MTVFNQMKSTPKNQWWWYGAVACAYGLLFVLFSWPLCAHFADGFIYENAWSDSPCYLWNAHHFVTAICAGQNPFITTDLLYPQGSSLWLHSYTPLLGLIHLFIPNLILSNNIVVALSFVLSGLFAAMLAHHYLKSRAMAFVCGFIFAFCPIKLAHLMAHADLMLTAMIPLGVLCTVKAIGLKLPGWWPLIISKRWAGLGLISLTICLLSNYYYTAYLLIFMVFYCAALVLLPRFKRISKLQIASIAVIAVVVSTAFVVLAEKLHLPRTEFYFGADILAPFIPAMESRFLSSDWVVTIHRQILKADPIENTLFAGYTLIVLFVLSAIIAVKNRFSGGLVSTNHDRISIIAIISAGFIVLSMPVLHIAGHPVGALPSAILQYIPFVNNFRVSGRYLLMVMLLAPIITGMLLLSTRLLQNNVRLRRWATLSVLVLLIIEYLPMPYPLFLRSDVPATIDYLAKQEKGALLSVPFGVMDGINQTGVFQSMQLYFQTIHHQPQIGGYLSRLDKSVYDSIAAQPVLMYVLAIQRNTATPQPTASQLQQFIASRNLRYILCNRQNLSEQAIERLQNCFKPWISESRMEGDLILWMIDQ